MARTTWDEMVEKYPDQWIAVKDAEMDGADIVSGEVVASEADTDMETFRINHFHDFDFYRTSEGDFNGFVTSANFGIRLD